MNEPTLAQMQKALVEPLQHFRRSLAASILPGYAGEVLPLVRFAAIDVLEQIAGPGVVLRPAVWRVESVSVDLRVPAMLDTLAKMTGTFPKPPHVYCSLSLGCDSRSSAPVQNALREVAPVASLLRQLTNDSRHVNGSVRYLYRLLIGREAAAAKFPLPVPPGQTFFMTRLGDWIVSQVEFGAKLPEEVALFDDGTWPERWAHLPPASLRATLNLPIAPHTLLGWLGVHAAGS